MLTILDKQIIASSDIIESFEEISIVAEESIIACGKEHTLLLQNGEVFGYGNNNVGQLGTGSKRPDFITRPQENKYIATRNITRITSGDDFVVALDVDNTIYTYGKNIKGK